MSLRRSLLFSVTTATISGSLAVPVAAFVPWEHPQDVLSSVMRAAEPASPRQALAGQRFDIPPGPLTDALKTFSQLTAVIITVSPDLTRGLTTPGVSGVFTPASALEQLLKGTALSFRFTGAGAATIEVRLRTVQVDVRAALPGVTSPKFTEPLRDTPQTITVIPQQVIEQQGATTLRDVLRNIPGITMQAGEGGGGLPGDSLTMRGFSASGDIFLDGVREVGPYSRDAFNLEQVEVIKGPASTFGGRGSTGGAINLTSKSPTLVEGRSGTVALGSADFRRTTVDLNEPLGALGHGASIRLNAMWQDAGVPGRDIVENGSWGVAPSIAAGLGTPTRLTIGYQHLKQDNVPDYGLPWGTYTDPATGQVYPTGAFNATPAVDQRNFYGLRNYDYEHINSDVATAHVERDLTPHVTVRNVTRYGDAIRDHAITAPRPPNRQLQRRWMRNETTANQSSLSATFATGALRHDLAAGAEFARENTSTRNSAQTTNQPQTTLQQPDPNELPFGPMPAIAGNPGTARTGTASAYAFDTVKLSNAWQVSGGLRRDRSHVDYEQTNLATGVVSALARTDRMTSWRAGIVFKPAPDATLYTGYGTSFNPSADAGTTGTALSAVDTAATSVNLAPEKSRNFEAGTKWTLFGQRLALTGAFFRTEKTNARTRNLNNDPFVLAGIQRVQGVELGASGQITRRWSALFGYSYMDSDIVSSLSAAEQGMDLALTPKRTASLWTTWDVNRRLSIGGGAQFMDAVFRNTANTLAVPSYWIANGMASYALNSHLTLRVNANNLADTRYADRVGGGHYVPGARRSVQVTAGVKF